MGGSIIFLLVIGILGSYAEEPKDPRSCPEICAATLCMRLPDNCTSDGGAVKRVYNKPTDCVCCDSCVFTVGKYKYCGFKDGYIYECGCNLRCYENRCIPNC